MSILLDLPANRKRTLAAGIFNSDMKLEDKTIKLSVTAIVVLWCFLALAWISFIWTAIYVAVHFIKKVW